MAEPSAIPEWMSDANFANADYTVAPSAARIERGYGRNEHPPAQIENHLRGNISRWIKHWKQDVVTWANQHIFKGLLTANTVPAARAHDAAGNVRHIIADRNGMPSGLIGEHRTEWIKASALPDGWSENLALGGAVTAGYLAPIATRLFRCRYMEFDNNADIGVTFGDAAQVPAFPNVVVTCEFQFCFDVVGANNMEIFVGLVDSSSAANPLAGTAEGLGLYYDGASATNWFFRCSDGAGNSVIDTGVAPAANTPVHVKLEIHGASTAMGSAKCVGYLNGTKFEITTTQPSSVAMLELAWGDARAGLAATVVMHIGPMVTRWNRLLAPSAV